MVHKVKKEKKEEEQIDEIDVIDSAILKKLVEEEMFMTTTEVAKKAKISWNTAILHLKTLHEKKLIDHIKRGNRDMWRAEGSKLTNRSP